MGEVIPFPSAEALRRELHHVHARLMLLAFRQRLRALLAPEANPYPLPPPRHGAWPQPSFLQHRDPGDEDATG